MGEITRLNLSWTLLFFGLFLGLFWGRSELLPTAAGGADMPLGSLLNRFSATYPIAAKTLAAVLLFLNSILLLRIVSRNMILTDRSYMPIIVYLLVAAGCGFGSSALGAITVSLLAVCSVSARDSRQKGTDGQAAIYRLPPFERAVRCTKYFEGWHSEKHHPYVGWGHQVQPGERYSARTMTKRQADALLRKDLRKFCAMFRKFGRDSLLLATLAYNVGPYRLLGSGKIPKSTLIRKLEAGDRNIYREYIAFCNYKGKRHAMLLKRRKAEFALLYIP